MSATRRDVRIAVVGGGLGGATAAILLHQAGFSVTVYELQPTIGRFGAGIHVSSNVMRVLRRIGVDQYLLRTGSRPRSWVQRKWDTGEVLVDLPLGDVAEEKYGAPYLTVHRGDFHIALTQAMPPGMLQLNKLLVGLEPAGGGTRLAFADGTTAEADIVVGADGVFSKVREILLGPEEPRYTGVVAHRAMVPMAALAGVAVDDCAKWWGPDSHLVPYFIDRDRESVYFVTGAEEPEWHHGTSNVPCSHEELQRCFVGFHPTVQALVTHCREITKWALLERDPLALWSRGNIVMLGDACHPMKPHMAQGAGMAIEDAAMLARCLEAHDSDPAYAFRLYEHNRFERASRVQRISHNNDWLLDKADPIWVYGYDVFGVPLVAPPATPVRQAAG